MGPPLVGMTGMGQADDEQIRTQVDPRQLGHSGGDPGVQDPASAPHTTDPPLPVPLELVPVPPVPIPLELVPVPPVPDPPVTWSTLSCVMNWHPPIMADEAAAEASTTRMARVRILFPFPSVDEASTGEPRRAGC